MLNLGGITRVQTWRRSKTLITIGFTIGFNAVSLKRLGLNIMSGLGTKSDVKQKRMEASELSESMKSENTRSLDVY